MSYVKKNGIILNVADPSKTVSDNECTVNIKYCGICGTDYQKYISMNDITEWGHEIVGLVEGEEDKGAVTVRTSFPCGKCKECLNDRPHQCTNWSRQCFNGYSNKVTLDRRCILFLQEADIGPEFTLVEPLYVAQSMIERVNLQMDDHLAIVGNGTIALLAGFLAQKRCTKRAIFARHHTQRRIALETSMALEQYDYSELQKSLHLYNKIIVTTPYSTLDDVIRYAGPYSMITFNGISNGKMISIDANTWHLKNLAIWPTFPHPQSDFAEEIKTVKENKSFLNAFITAIYPENQIDAAFRDLLINKKDHIKMIIRF